MTNSAAQVRDSALAAIVGLREAWLYLLRRPVRGPRPRIGTAGIVELAALTILIAGLTAASMILVDPLVSGLRLRLSQGVVHLFERITELGLGSVVLWPIGLGLLAILGVMPRLAGLGRRIGASVVARLGFLFVSIAGAGLLVLVMKYALGRARPYAALHLSGPNAQLTFDWLALQSSYASFPSGHSAIVFSTAVAFAALFPRARTPLIAIAVLVASSRVILGSHYPSDVLAGGAIAAAFTLLMVKLFAARRLVFCVAGDGAIRPKPGPAARHLARLVPPSAPQTAFEEARS
ncbi:phosphatase PAP2 family protein [Aquabacter spiritensis]|uniref:Undecaprenyl-diphosphatase n=1 Tax=Aquabacter spiritensis TaxID=933073 RepID=A0A4R3LQ97_9HYPH|nr:phosphatase PAP2 family protein [Aquabacter spiritensis]TCT02663.1 undecaprenyl-diphosphatase [Aquabacter spiritensis]